MNEPQSSCEVPAAPRPESAPASRVLRFAEGFRWEGVEAEAYKSPAAHWCGIRRMSLIGERGESTKFQMRYFEIVPGGYSSFEQHAHEHAVFVLRGRGEAQLGDAVHQLGYGDVVYVGPHEPHQFRNTSGEAFGFLCVVDAERDRPVPLSGSADALPPDQPA